MTMTLLQLQVLNWRSFSYIISANLFALLFHFLWCKNDHIYSSAALKKNINARSLTMRVQIFQPQCYVPVTVLRVGYAEVIFIQPDGKLDTMWHGAWQRLATRHQGEMWPLQINGQCSRTVLPLTRLPETHKLAVWEPSVHWANFCPPNSPDLNTVNLPSGVLFSRWSTIINVSPQLTKWRERLSKAWQKLPHGTIIANINHFYHFFVYG